MDIIQPTLTSVTYDFENGKAVCTVKYNMGGIINKFPNIELSSADVLTKAGTGLTVDSLEASRSMCQTILNMPVVLYNPEQ
jgi:hypothetical protein